MKYILGFIIGIIIGILIFQITYPKYENHTKFRIIRKIR